MKYLGLFISSHSKGRGLDIILQLDDENVLKFLGEIDRKLDLLEQTKAFQGERKSLKHLQQSQEGQARFFLRIIPFYDENGKPSVIINSDHLIFASSQGQEAWMQFVGVVNASTVTFEKSVEKHEEYKILCTPSLYDPSAFLKSRYHSINPFLNPFKEIFYHPDDEICLQAQLQDKTDLVIKARNENQAILELIEHNPRLFPEYFHMRKTVDHFITCINEQHLRMNTSDQPGIDGLTGFKSNVVFLSTRPEISFGKIGVAFSELSLFHNVDQNGDVLADDLIILPPRTNLCEYGAYWHTKTEIRQPWPFIISVQDPTSKEFQALCTKISEEAPTCKILNMHKNCIDIKKWEKYLKTRYENSYYYFFNHLEKQFWPSTYVSQLDDTVPTSSVSNENLICFSFNEINGNQSVQESRSELRFLTDELSTFFINTYTDKHVNVEEYYRITDLLFDNVALRKEFEKFEQPDNYARIKKHLEKMVLGLAIFHKNTDESDNIQQITKHFLITCIKMLPENARKDAFIWMEKYDLKENRFLNKEQKEYAISEINLLLSVTRNWRPKNSVAFK